MEKRNGSTEIRHSSRKRKAVFVLLLFVWAAPLLLQSLLPNTDWDGEAYHLPMAERFRQIGIYEVDTIHHWYNYPGSAHLFYSAFLGLRAESAILPTNLIFSAGIVAAVYALTLAFWDRKAAWAAAAICASVSLLWEVGLSPRIESYVSFFALLACFAFLLWLRDSRRPGYLLLICAGLGAAIGFKVTGFFFALIIVPAMIILSLPEIRKKGGQAVMPLVAAGLLITIPSSWWYLRNAAKLGDPVYPIRSGLFFEDEAGRRVHFNTALSKAMMDMPDDKAIRAAAEPYGLDFLYRESPIPESPHNLLNLWDILRHPEHYRRKPHENINGFIFLGLFLPLFSRNRYAWSILGIGIAVYIMTGFDTPIIRYALPAVAFFAAAAGIVLSRIPSKMVSGLLALLIGLSLAHLAILQGVKFSSVKPWLYFSATESRLEWLSHVGYNTVKTAPPFILKINTLVDTGVIGPEETLLLIGEGKGYLLKCSYIPDSSRTGFPWLIELMRSDFDYDRTAASLKGRGIFWIAVNTAFFEGVTEFYPVGRKPFVFSLYHFLKFIEGRARVHGFEGGFLLVEII